MTVLYVVRHLKTSWNSKGFCQGWKSGRILNHSYKDLDIILDLLSNVEINHVVSSDLTRAKITAQIIKKRMNILKNIKYSKNFRELNFGIFEGRHYTNIALQQPEIYDDKSYFKYDLRLISGESMSDLILRVKQGLNDFEKIKGNILLITHGSVIRALYSILNKIDYNEVYSSEDIDIIKYHKFIINN